MSGTAKTKLQLILELKKKLFDNKLVEAQRKFTAFADKTKGKVKELQHSHVKAFSAMKAQFPAFGGGLDLLTNKYALMAGGVAAVSAGVLLLGSHLLQESKKIEAFQTKARASLNLQGEALKKTTAQALSISDVLKVDQFELLKSANALTKEYEDQGLTINDSLKLIKQGIQATGGNFDLKEVEEYASQIKSAGLSAEQFIALSAFSKKQGIFNDKGVDTIKEFNLRIKEMTPLAMEALKGIGLSGKAILKGLDDGSLKTIDIVKKVSKSMGDANTQARQTALTDLFGGAGEDAGIKYILSLKDVNLSLKEQSRGMEDITGHQNEMIRMNKKLQKSYMTIDDAIKPIRKEWEFTTAKAKVFFFKVIAKGYKSMIRQTKIVKNQIADMNVVQMQFQKTLFSSTLQATQLFEELRRAGEGTKLQEKILAQINNQYGDYLQNRLTEKTTLTDIATAQQKINEGIKTEIALKSKKDQIVALETALFKRQHDTLNAFADASNLTPGIIAEKFRAFEETNGSGIKQTYEFGKNGFTSEKLAEFNEAEKLTFRMLLKAKSSTQNEIKKISDFFNAYIKGDTLKTSGFDDDSGEESKSSSKAVDIGGEVATVVGSGGGAKSIVINIEALNKGGINTENTVLSQMNPEEIEKWFTQAMNRLIRNVELGN